MFTGIVQAIALIKDVQKKNGVIMMRIALPPRWRFQNGQSVSVNGICTTVIATTKNAFDVEYMPETLRKTTAGSWTIGTKVNLERSLSYGDSIDGQLLPGHVDARTKILKIVEEGASKLITLEVPKSLSRLVPLHGWIAVDGVSLTVARRAGVTATVALVPYTLSVTTLSALKKGDLVNIEAERPHALKASQNRAKVPAHASRTKKRRS